MEDFYKSLSDAEWDMAEAIESEIEVLLREGLTEPVAIKFVQTVMAVRGALPDANVGGVFDAALSVGLSYVGDKRTIARMRSGQFAWATNEIKPKKRNSSKQGSTLK